MARNRHSPNTPFPTTYSPGPWKTWHDFDEDGDNNDFIIGQVDGGPLAVTIFTTDERGHTGEKNALLMATAPELLESLEALLFATADIDVNPGEGPTPATLRYNSAVLRANRAIAAARGA